MANEFPMQSTLMFLSNVFFMTNLLSCQCLWQLNMPLVTLAWLKSNKIILKSLNNLLCIFWKWHSSDSVTLLESTQQQTNTAYLPVLERVMFSKNFQQGYATILLNILTSCLVPLLTACVNDKNSDLATYPLDFAENCLLHMIFCIYNRISYVR